MSLFIYYEFDEEILLKLYIGKYDVKSLVCDFF